MSKDVTAPAFVYAGGVFIRTGGGWLEYGSGALQPDFTFVEDSRDADFLILRDDSRAYRIAIPLDGGMAQLSDNGADWTDFADVAPVPY